MSAGYSRETSLCDSPLRGEDEGGEDKKSWKRGESRHLKMKMANVYGVGAEEGKRKKDRKEVTERVYALEFDYDS